MTPQEAVRLANILARLGSDFDGERAAAGLLASRFLRERNLTWHDLLTLPPPADLPREEAPRTAWRDHLALAMRHRNCLTEWERNFVGSLSRRPRLTPKQAAVMSRIAAGLRARGLV